MRRVAVRQVYNDAGVGDIFPVGLDARRVFCHLNRILPDVLAVQQRICVRSNR
ncbi:hypothetical protein J6590_026994 [Homalodisca vitripennis]|nr:hypothetical protein J6590_026994 [Homalodisca vitripennis]